MKDKCCYSGMTAQLLFLLRLCWFVLYAQCTYVTAQQRLLFRLYWYLCTNKELIFSILHINFTSLHSQMSLPVGWQGLSSLYVSHSSSKNHFFCAVPLHRYNQQVFFTVYENTEVHYKVAEENCPSYPSFEGSKARWFGIRCQVRQPESCRHMHDEADTVSVLDLCHPHAVHVPLWAQVTLFLLCWHGETRNHIAK